MVAMGIGDLGAPGVILKRKFRFTLEIATPCGNVPASFVKVAARPSLDIDETELNFLNGVTWIPGKGKWQPITVTYYDTNSNNMGGLLSWIATVYDFTDPINLKQSEKAGWNGTALLTMYDGCGGPMERWLLGSVWPQSVNFGDLDYGNSEEATIELTLKYSEVRYQGICGPSPSPCCQGC